MALKSYDEVVQFHGHSCPGLAMGYRMASAALEVLGEKHSTDEELVAIVENNACGVDALQYLSGCTFGKGNLIFKDYGKHVYTLYDRRSRNGVRVLFRVENLPSELRGDRKELLQWILSAPQEQVIRLEEVVIEEPPPARIMKSVMCDFCGEAVMETRIIEIDGKRACIPCAGKRGKFNG
ncbi:MAG TPA: formylmethanofuran dehydrogenase [Desulfobacteraceae bacterium]|nr:formylmethanofuran dehydrogenase [Desulfobacteraceae bacterium]